MRKDLKLNHFQKKKLTLTKELEKTVTYHDPCFLGRQNQLFDEPRHILTSIPAVTFVEMDRIRERALCCEGGGGRMFYEAESNYPRNSEKRVKEAIEKGADVLATSCPFCVMTLEDPATEKELPVKELSEIIMEIL